MYLVVLNRTPWICSDLHMHVRKLLINTVDFRHAKAVTRRKGNFLQEDSSQPAGWLGVTKVLCILRHRGVQLILAYSWARPAILVAGKGRGGMFLFLLFLYFYSSTLLSLSLSFISTTIPLNLLSPFLWETTQNDPQGLTYHQSIQPALPRSLISVFIVRMKK